MAGFTNPGGHDMTDRINMDGLGKLLLTLTALWTVVLACGVAFLIKHRHLSIIRMRRLELCIGAVVTLHVYWCACMLAYIINGRFECATEFWIMSTFLPWGVAFYQLSNTQLLSVVRQQQKFAEPRPIQPDVKAHWAKREWRGILDVYRTATATSRTLIGLECGMAIQGCLTLVLFLSSRKFHPSFGLFGEAVSKAECRLGFEWWPSFAWQLIWSWIYAPYLLWQIRGVKDVHAWRLQTVLCSVAGLPATPLWIASLHSSAFGTINRYWVPPLWFSPCIVIMEASTVFIPCWQILQNRMLHNDTMNTLTEWEARQKDSGSSSSATLLSADTRSFSKPVGKTLVPKNYKLSSTREIYTMVALEKVLETNPTPLLHFASYRDFSGENISFLNCVRHWKASWQPRQGERRSVPLNSEYQTLRRQYATAVEIYSSYVSPQYSEFPVNLSSTHLKELNRIFSDAAAKVNCAVEHHPATPFESVTPGMHSNSSYTKGDLEPGYGHELKSFSVTSAPCDDKNFEENNGNFSRHGDTESYVSARQSTHGKMEVRLPSDFPIPESFDPTVFDRAEASIKYLVLTSTWPKFIAAGHPNMPAKKGPLEITKEFLQQRLKRRSNMERLV